MKDLHEGILELFAEAEGIPDAWGRGHSRDDAWLESTNARLNARRRETREFESGLERKKRLEGVKRGKAFAAADVRRIRDARKNEPAVAWPWELRWCVTHERFDRCTR